MILFFECDSKNIIAADTTTSLAKNDIDKLVWLFGNAAFTGKQQIDGTFIGPRKEMVTPWSTNAVEITQNMGISGITRIEEFHAAGSKNPHYDPMLQALYRSLDQRIFTIDRKPDPVFYVDDIAEYNHKEGLALNADEIEYLNKLSKSIGRKLTDSEVFGFSQVNSEHCRHKIFNGKFIIDGKEKQKTLFQMIKDTTKTNPNHVVSAYKDNCAFLDGPVAEQFA
ncbi:MAG: phosphoribosylformylglycinamidine synthase, partial [Bacteroidia bacterium]|nr:phosphoribosylformylglycinamidine synthase [Bacteroidia bacterium]